MGWTIRPMDPSEASLAVPLLGELQAVHAEARPDAFRGDATFDELRALLHGMLTEGGLKGLLAVEDDGRAIGYAVFGIGTVEASALRHAACFGVLHHICVHRDRRNRGLGSALVGEVKARLRVLRVPHLRASHWAFNAASAALMRRAGLAPATIRVEGPT